MMSSNQSSEMNQILFVSTEQLVPKGHLLRKVADLVDFNFVIVTANFDKGHVTVFQELITRLGADTKDFTHLINIHDVGIIFEHEAIGVFTG